MALFPTRCPACEQPTLEFDEERVHCTNCKLYDARLNLRQRALVWAGSRSWWWRAIIIGLFLIMLVQNLKDPSFALNRLSNPFSMIDFGIHELGHLIFIPFGTFMTILGGSLFQCIFPMLWLIGALQKRWYFFVCMTWCWLGLNLFDVATYAADARARLLPLAVGPGGIGADGDEAYDHAHDWYQILSRTNLLDADLVIAQGMRVAAVVCFVVGFVLGGILVWQMIQGAGSRASKS